MRPELPRPCLCLVTDRGIVPEGDLVRRAARAVAGGIDMVQLREKDVPGRQLLDLAGALKEAIGDSALLVINERVDVVAAARVAGVQLGEEALPVDAARDILGPQALIGRSVHSLVGAVRAVEQGADFLVVGTIFATRSHPGEEPAGPELIRSVAAECPVPLIGIGGVNLSNVGQVMSAGASGVAVITSILAAPDPERAAQDLKQAMLSATSVSRGT